MGKLHMHAPTDGKVTWKESRPDKVNPTMHLITIKQEKHPKRTIKGTEFYLVSSPDVKKEECSVCYSLRNSYITDISVRTLKYFSTIA